MVIELLNMGKFSGINRDIKLVLDKDGVLQKLVFTWKDALGTTHRKDLEKEELYESMAITF